MNSQDFREIEAGLASSHAEMAALLGLSEVSVKRFATGAQPIPPRICKLTVAMLLVSNEGLQAKFAKLLARYHCDT